MSAKNPTIRRIAWWYTIPQLLLMHGLILLIWRVQFPDQFSFAVVYGALGYLVYSFGSKAILLRHHRHGIRFLNLGLFREAISEFDSSYSFLTKYSWIDQYRLLTVLDSSAIPYREMALCNNAYSYVQLDDKASAKEYYRKALKEFPQSDLAESGLEYLEPKESR